MCGRAKRLIGKMILACLVAEGILACDRTIHEYPRSTDVVVLVELNADRTPPVYYKGLNYNEKGEYFEEELTPEPSRAYVPDERLCTRFVVELYRLPSASATVDKGLLYERREIVADRLAQPPQDTLAFHVPEGYYRVLAWGDYTPETQTGDWHYDTHRLNAVKEHVDQTLKVNHHKNSAAGSCDFSVTSNRRGNEVSVGVSGNLASVTPAGDPIVTVHMERPSGRFRLWATDLQEFSKKRSLSVNDLQIKIVYKQYVSVGYNVETSTLNAFIESRDMDMTPVTVADDGSLLLAYDYVLTDDGREDHVLIDVFVYDENGDEVNHYQNIDVPLYRNRETVLRGPFLTQNVGSGDIGIDDGFDDEFVVVIPD